MVCCRPVSESPARQNSRYHLRSGGFRNDIVTTLDDATTYVDRESGTKYEIVGEVAPLGNPGSKLPWTEQNLRLCGCTREQLVQRDLNDCPHCGRRMPAVNSARNEASR